MSTAMMAWLGSSVRFLLLAACRALPAPDLPPCLALLLPLRLALPAFLLALRAGLANRSRHGAHPVSMVSWYVDHPFRDGLWHAGLHRGKQARSFLQRPSTR